MVTARARVAVLGGDGRLPVALRDGAEVRVYKSPRDGGVNDVHRLEASIKAGSIDRVVVLARWNAHGATQRIRKLCRRLGIPVDVLP